MIRALILAVLLLMPALVRAQTVEIQSGDHQGFTRLVLDLGAPGNWILGRTPDGYALRVDREGVRFDVSGVFRLIGRDRLAAIWVDGASGDLRLGLGCACHAIPFEFRPGLVVIDLRDGPPPAGSSFEQAFEGQTAIAAAGEPVIRPRPRPKTPQAGPDYDWTAPRHGESTTGAAAAKVVPLANPDLSPLRDTLLRLISDGAARGVVDIADPTQLEAPAPDKTSAPRQVRIGPDLGVVVGPAARFDGHLTGNGDLCIADSRLDVAAWGSDLPVAEQIATARSGLSGEFDRPEPEAVARAVRFYLFLGFGAEARQILRAVDVAPEDRVVWETMAAVLDDGAATEGPFAGMMVCDTAAALWATLARAQLSAADNPNTAAVTRSFSALPLHLRRHLGPILADRFLARGDMSTARAVQAAILRAPGEPGPELELVQAAMDLAGGETAEAEDRLRGLAASGGPAATEASIKLVESLVAQGKPVDPPAITAIAALAHEHKGTEDGDRLNRAHVLALATSGDFQSAFDRLAQAPQAQPDLWRILAEQGPDSAVLERAMRPSAEAIHAAPAEARRLLAERLVGLGFGAAALSWLPDKGGAEEKAAPQDRILAARAQLQRRDARAALRLLAGLTEKEAVSLRAQANSQLGDPAAAADFYAVLGEVEAVKRATRVSRNWTQIAEVDEGPWGQAASLLTPTEGVPAAPAADGGTDPARSPLARGHRLVEESAAAREVLDSLLSAATMPTAGPAN